MRLLVTLAVRLPRTLGRSLTIAVAVTVTAGALLLGTSASPHAATGTTGQPTAPVRIATPADDVNHPGTLTEWWYVAVSDPATQQSFIVNFTARPTPRPPPSGTTPRAPRPTRSAAPHR